MSARTGRTVRLGDLAATARLAEELAARCVPGQVVGLTGVLGAGKTTLVAAYARALGVTAPVTSPTFTLVHHYRCGPGAPVATLLHVDLWRLEDARELADLALDEELDDGAAAIVEWADRFDVAGDRPRIDVTLRVRDDATREATIASRPSASRDAVAGGAAP